MKTKLLILAAVLAASIAPAQQTVFEYPDGLTVKFNPNGTRAGFNFGSLAGDPSSPQNGDAWYNSTTGKVKFYAGGSTLIIGEADLTQLNAGNLTSGTVPDARFPATLPALSGANLTALNASNLGSGTVPDARFPATLPAISGANLTALNAANLGSGTIPDARFPATLPALSGANLTALNAGNLASGTILAARMPAFTGDATSSAGAVALTLATVNANVGSFGSSTAIPTFTVNAKGLITAASTNAVVAPAGTLTGTTLAANVTGSSLTGVGTITSGTWNAGIIPGQYGGTGVNNAGKTLTLGGSYTINGTTGSTLNIGTGGTLGAAAFIGASLGGSGAADSTKAATFNTDGSLSATRYLNVTGLTLARVMNFNADDLTIYFQEVGWADQSGLMIPTDMGQDSLNTIATREWVGGQGYGNAQLDDVFQKVNNLSEVPDAAAARQNLGLTIGTNVQAYNAGLSAFGSAYTGSSGRVIYTSAPGVMSETVISPFGISLIDDNDATAGRNTLGATAGVFPVSAGGSGVGTLTGIVKGNGTSAFSAATAGTDYLSPGATQTVTATTLDSQAGTNVLKFLDEYELTNPHQVDGTGAVIDAVSTSPTYGHAVFSGGVDKATNYALYRFRVPFDLDTAVDLSACLTIRLAAADTGKQAFEISMAEVNSSASADAPTFTNAVALNFTGDASGASGDIETLAYTTLTSWRSSLTAGRIIVIKLARDGDDGTNDTSTQACSDVSLTLKFGRSQ